MIVMYQPQLESFDDNKLTARAAVSVTRTGQTEPVFGAVWLNARVSTDRDSRVVTLLDVDIADVNDPVVKPWLDFDSKYSPVEMIENSGFANFVQFVTGNSLEYLSNCKQKYDFIFLDGDHRAQTVYREIPAALKLLKKEGVILLHDFYPDLKPLWSDGFLIPGPVLATDRLIAEKATLAVIPLGDLPWPTKLGSHKTSLALLLKTE